MERTDIENMRRIPLADFLARLGHEPVRRSGNELWYRAPYRNERTPSFRVNVAKQLWYDFGLGKGGDIFTLAGEFVRSGDFMVQARFISEAAHMPLTALPAFEPKPRSRSLRKWKPPGFSLSADGISEREGYPLRCRITSLLPPELRCAREKVFCSRFPQCGGRL